MGNNPSIHIGDSLLVENVSWNDCQAFISKLNKITGLAFRLPTEAEWEYAAQGGKYAEQIEFKEPDEFSKYVWASSNSNHDSHSVKKLLPNKLGLYDMLGNVMEWCNDYSDTYENSNLTEYNPQGPESGTDRIIRGDY